MIGEIFSELFSQETFRLAEQESRENLCQKLLEGLEREEPLQVMQHTLAYHSESLQFIRHLLESDDSPPAHWHEAKSRISSRPLQLKYSLLLTLFFPEEEARRELAGLRYQVLDSNSVTFILNLAYILLRQGRGEAVDLVTQLKVELFSTSQKIQWLKQVAYQLDRACPSRFSWGEEDSLLAEVHRRFPREDSGLAATPEIWQKLVQALWEQIQISHEKDENPPSWEPFGTLLCLSQGMEGEEKVIEDMEAWLDRWYPKNILVSWLELIRTGDMEEKLDPFLESLGEAADPPSPSLSFALLRPLLARFSRDKSRRGRWKKAAGQVFPGEDRIQALAYFADDDKVEWIKSSLQSLGEMVDPFRRLKGLVAFTSTLDEEEYTRHFDQLVALTEVLKPAQKKTFWRGAALLPWGSHIPLDYRSQVVEEIRDFKDPLGAAEVLLRLAEAHRVAGRECPSLVDEANKLLKMLRGRENVYGSFLQVLWTEGDQGEGRLEDVFRQVEAMKVASRRLPLMEKLFQLGNHSPFLLKIARRLQRNYLRETLSAARSQFVKLTSCLSMKAVIARGWDQAECLFEKALQLARQEEEDHSLESQFTVISDLAEIAEYAGTEEAWNKALECVGKLNNGYVQRNALVRLLHLPSYAISNDGAKITRILKEMTKIRDEVERYMAFVEGIEQVGQRAHLIGDKSSLFSTLKRLARSFRSPEYTTHALSQLALFCLRWERPREGEEFFSAALELASHPANEYKRFQAIEGLAHALAQAFEFDGKGEYVHDLMEIAEDMEDYQGEMYALIAYILEEWNRGERASTALEKALQLACREEDEIRRAQAFQYLANILARSTPTGESSLLQELIQGADEGVKTPLILAETLSHLGLVCFGLGERRLGREIFQRALEQAALVELPTNRLEVLLEVVGKISESGLFDEEIYLFDQALEIGRAFSFVPHRDKVAGRVVEAALQNSLPKYAIQVLRKIHSLTERTQTQGACALYFLYRDPKRALDFAEEMELPYLQWATVRKLARNQALFKEPSLGKRIFVMSLAHEYTSDTVLAVYLKSLGASGALMGSLEKI